MTRNHSADILGFGNHDIVGFASGNHSAGSLAFGYVSGGLGRRPGGKFNRVTRDCVASPGHPCHSP
jgi:hypothetical protein